MLKVELKGQRILVTGAATGIGRACALMLAGQGAEVWINHLGQAGASADLVEQIRAVGGRAVAIEADVSDPDAVEEMFACITATGPLHGLVNNAGIIQEQGFLDTSEDDWRRIMAVDLDGVYRCCRCALESMSGAGRGAIVNIASELGQLGRENYVAYCTAKAGVIGMTKALAREFAPAIRINAVAPGPVETAMVSPEHMSEEWIARELAIPAARLGQPEEIAAAVCFLLSPAASFFTGQVLGANGGAWMGG